MKSPRLWACILLLCAAGLVLLRRGDSDRVPNSLPLTQFPVDVAHSTGTDAAIAPEVLEVMGNGAFLNRLYAPDPPSDPPRTAPAGQPPAGPVALFIAYFATQRTGQSIHSPQNCLPGSGWTFETSGSTDFTDDTGKTHHVGDYVITDGAAHDEVLYWYQTHGRTIATDYKAKLAMIVDSVRYNRSDAALVRIITPLQAGESRVQAHARAIAFAQHLMPLLPPYIPN